VAANDGRWPADLEEQRAEGADRRELGQPGARWWVMAVDGKARPTRFRIRTIRSCLDMLVSKIPDARMDRRRDRCGGCY